MFEFNATLLVAMISFVVFMFIMNAIYYRPIFDIINKRDEYIDKNYSEAKELNIKTEEHNKDYESKLSQAKEKGRNDVAAELDKIQKESFEKITEAKGRAKDELQKEKEILLGKKQELENQINVELVSNLSDIITSKIVG